MDKPALAGPRSLNEVAGDWFAGCVYRLGLWHPYFRLKSQQDGGSPVAILTFHRLVDDETVYLYKGPTVHTHISLFEQIIAWVSRYYRVVSLDEVVEAFKKGKPFARDSVAITFDDGYEDTFRLGLPVLKRYGVPATVFVATGFIDSPDPMWTDRIEQAILHTQRMTISLHELGIECEESELPIGALIEKRVASAKLARMFKLLDADSLATVLARLEALLEPDKSRYARVMMTWQELEGLHEGGVEIASHGVTHNIMTNQEFRVARQELRESKAVLEANLGIRVNNFAFPNGRKQDFSPELVEACRELGYQSVCSAEWGLCAPGAGDRYFLHRVGLTRNVPRSLMALESAFHRWHRDAHRPGIQH